jgi:transcriptional regulator with XRE-family HTH domain
MLTFGQRLLLMRRQRDLTQKALATEVGLNINTLSRAERSAGATLSGDYLKKIAHALDVSADYLLGLSDDPRSQRSSPEMAATTGDTRKETPHAHTN